MSADSFSHDAPAPGSLPAVAARRATGQQERSTRFPVLTLGLGAFVVIASEFLPASVLPLLAGDLGISEGMAGQAITATAVMGFVAAPTLAGLLPRMDRRRLLAGLMGLALVSNAAVALAPSFPILLASRLLLGVAIAGFWSISLAAVSQLVPANRLGRAMAVVNTGVTTAMIAAIPLGAYVGDAIGWRPLFWAAAAAAAGALALQLAWLPSLEPSGSPGMRTLWHTARSRVLVTGLAGIGLIAGGHFAAFTYVRPAAERVPGLGSAELATLLVAFGVAAFLGNLGVGLVADARLALALLVVPVLIGASISSVALLADSYASVLTAVAVWGFAFGGVGTLAQTWVARVEPDRLESASGLMVMTFQLAIAAGASLGGLLVETTGVRTALLLGGSSAALGGLLISSTQRKRGSAHVRRAPGP